MATATITGNGDGNGTASERVGEWFSGAVIDFLDDLQTDMTCRIEAFAGDLSAKMTEAALRAAYAGVGTMLADLGVPTAQPSADGAAAEQKVLNLQARRDGNAQPTAPSTPASATRARGTRAPREGGIASEIKTFLAEHQGETFTASAIAKGLPGDRSSGAVDAAAKRMTERGELAVASESPRRYQLPDAAH